MSEALSESDYKVNIIGHRELTSSYTEDTAAQTTFRLEEEYNAGSDETARTRYKAGSAVARTGSRYVERDEWGAFYTELEDIQAQIGQDTKLIQSLRDQVRHHVLSKYRGTLEETSPTTER